MNERIIACSVDKILQSLPTGVLLVAAAKTRNLDEVNMAIQSGVKMIGYNYVQEAANMFGHLGNRVKWHMIGHLQRNKAKRAVQIFDMIETIDSLKIAQTLNRYCEDIGKIMPVLIEINSGRESNKTGVSPEGVDELINTIRPLPNLRIQGLMTMGPRFGNPEDARPYFKATRMIFESLKNKDIANVQMKYLSMGMSNSYKIAVEEGANIVRIGRILFGER